MARLDSTWDGRYGPMARAGIAGNWAFTLELASFEGARPEVLRRVSAGTTAGCVFSDIEGATGFGYAENGTVRARLDDLLGPAEQGQVGLGWPLAGLGRTRPPGPGWPGQRYRRGRGEHSCLLFTVVARA